MCLTRTVHCSSLDVDLEVTLCVDETQIGVSVDVIQSDSGDSCSHPTVWWSEEVILKAKRWRYLPARAGK